MNETTPVSTPGRFWAYTAVIVGGLLFLSGLTAVGGYLGLPALTASGQDVLGAQLGQTAAIFLGLGSGGLALYHGLSSIMGKRSQPLRLPPFYILLISFGLVIGLGNLPLIFDVGRLYLFPFFFLLGAALPTLVVLAWAGQRLGWPISWRQGSLALVCGSTLSILVTILLGLILPFLVYLFLGPLQFLAENIILGFGVGQGTFLERLFFSPLILIFLVYTALAAPIPEEFAKALALPIFGRQRVKNERQAFMLGLAAGAGFAILENMLYQGLYAQWAGWSWGGVTALRGIGSVLHPLCTGLVALGWFRLREQGAGQLLRAYALAVGWHTLWNGGFGPFVYLSGLDQYQEAYATVSIYGQTAQLLLIVYLAGLSAVLWRQLARICRQLGPEGATAATPIPISTRAVAIWAVVCAFVIIPLGTAAAGTAVEQRKALQQRVFVELWTAVNDNYVSTDFNGLDWAAVKETYPATIQAGLTNEEFWREMKEVVASLDDEHSAFLTPEETVEIRGSAQDGYRYTGIGVNLLPMPEKDYAVVSYIFANSPAAKAGLSLHDRLLAANGRAVCCDEMGYLHQDDMIRRSVGTEVTVTVQTPGEEPRDVVIRRDWIRADFQVEARRLEGDIGYILIPTLYQASMGQGVRSALIELNDEKPLRGIILDLRVNQGGLDLPLHEVLSLFTVGYLGEFHSRDSLRPLRVQWRDIGRSQVIPIAVLIGPATDGYAEILAGCLHQTGRATLIGQPTNGNIQRWMLYSFSDGSSANITVEKFTPARGADWERNGLTPDIEINQGWDEFAADAEDEALRAALIWLQR